MSIPLFKSPITVFDSFLTGSVCVLANCSCPAKETPSRGATSAEFQFLVFCRSCFLFLLQVESRTRRARTTITHARSQLGESKKAHSSLLTFPLHCSSSRYWGTSQFSWVVPSSLPRSLLLRFYEQVYFSLFHIRSQIEENWASPPLCHT